MTTGDAEDDMNRRLLTAPRIGAGIALVIGLVLLGLWLGGGQDVAISSDDAIAIALTRVEADGAMTLEGRETVVEDDGENWHVLFPLLDPNVRGGEPHVFISKEDGSITDVYYTQ